MIRLYRPKKEDLWFRRKMLEDAETMSYNHAYGGTIPFPEEKWKDWYCRWVEDGTGKHFYRYLQHEEGAFVGEVAFHPDENGECMIDVVVFSAFRKKGYGAEGLSLLLAAAREQGFLTVRDLLAPDNPALSFFLKAGFQVLAGDEKGILIEKKL